MLTVSVASVIWITDGAFALDSRHGLIAVLLLLLRDSLGVEGVLSGVRNALHGGPSGERYRSVEKTRWSRVKTGLIYGRIVSRKNAWYGCYIDLGRVGSPVSVRQRGSTLNRVRASSALPDVIFHGFDDVDPCSFCRAGDVVTPLKQGE